MKSLREQKRKQTKPKADSLKIATKSQCFRQMKLRKKERRLNEIRNKSGDITTASTEIKNIRREQYEQFHINKLDSLDEMDKFMEIQNYQDYHEEIENWNRPLISEETESEI